MVEIGMTDLAKCGKLRPPPGQLGGRQIQTQEDDREQVFLFLNSCGVAVSDIGTRLGPRQVGGRSVPNGMVGINQGLSDRRCLLSTMV
jgi:hypothetical protein